MSDDSVKLLDLTKKGYTDLYTVSNRRLESVSIISMNGMNWMDIFTQKEKPNADDEHMDGLWEAEIEVNIVNLILAPLSNLTP